MKNRKLYFLLLIFLIIPFIEYSQSFVKVYSDLHQSYYGINVLPVANEQTAVLGWYYGGDAFTTLVDSEGNKLHTTIGYERFVTEEISNLTSDGSGFVFYNGFGANNMGNPNDETLIFHNDTLGIDSNSSFYYALYAYSDNINLNYVIKKGLFFTCTSWTHGIVYPYKRYSKTFISKYDTIGDNLWNNNFSPSDTDQIYSSIITSDSGIAVIGEITDSTQLKKYDFNGNFLWVAKFPSLVNISPIIAEVKNNILAFGTLVDAFTLKNQLSIEVTNLSGSLMGQTKFILNKDTANITPISVGLLSDTTAIVNYSIAGSTLSYYLKVDYKGDSLGSFTLPAHSVSTFDNGNILCALDSNNEIIVREYNAQASLVYKYTYKPFDSLNICYDIKPLTYPGRFVLTGSSNNDLLIIRQDTSAYSLGINNLEKKSEGVNVFPNPSNGSFTVQLSVISGQSSVEVYNVLGEKVYSQFNIQNSTFNINLNNQANGVYLVRILSKDGFLVSQKKVVKTQ